MISVNTRMVGRYVDAKLEVGGVIHELGLFNITELEELFQDLKAATEDIGYYLDRMTPEEQS